MGSLSLEVVEGVGVFFLKGAKSRNLVIVAI